MWGGGGGGGGALEKPEFLLEGCTNDNLNLIFPIVKKHH